jgi:Fe-S-cluster containining protein
LLPLIQQLTNAVVGLAETAVHDQGKAISCQAGCGACCRQLVPVTRAEAHHLKEVIEALPEPRRRILRDRFAAGKQQLANVGMLDSYEQAEENPDRMRLGRDYFRLGIACPFLEEESCSIHADRPLACREYLVTSPPEQCRSDSEGTIRKVLLPARPMPAFASLDGETVAGGIHWLPLLLAPEWAETHPDTEPLEPGNELFARFMTAMNRNKTAE